MGIKLTDSPKDYTFGKRKNRWPWIIAGGSIALILIGVGAYLVYGKTIDSSDAGKNKRITEIMPRVLDGVLLEGEKANLFPLCIMIDNHSSVRPQSGLSKAGVVYEVLAEGGITRFMAVFAVNGDVEFGPIRSARPYFVDLAREYNCLFLHAGASPQGDEEIINTNILDFNQRYHPTSFYRIPGSPYDHVLYEHTLFSNLGKIEISRVAMKIKDRGTYEGWPFKEDAPVANPSLKNIVVDFSTSAYKVEYIYKKDSNAYLRKQAGTIAEDKQDNSEITPKNVALMFTSSTLYDELRRNISVVGQGKLVLFQDGQSIIGTWRKSSPESRLEFLDSTGAKLALNRGQTWVEVIDIPEKNITY
ncbi:MAG: DUF3048 domain-containing protein [Patescibacteria group bacterium]|jgi:hypothetical protein